MAAQDLIYINGSALQVRFASYQAQHMISLARIVQEAVAHHNAR